MQFKSLVGQLGQKIARDWIVARGYQLLEENFYTRVGEIDLVLKDDDQLIFAEVKTRLSADYGAPEEAITKSKLEKIYQAGLVYIEQKNIQDDNFRLDCLAIEIDRQNKKALIRHHKNIS